MREVTIRDGRVLPLAPPVRTVTLAALIEARATLDARYWRLREAWLDGDPDDDAGDGRRDRIGTLLARCQARIGAIEHRAHRLLLTWGKRSAWHAGWLVEQGAERGGATRARFVRTPHADEIGPLPVHVAAGWSTVVVDQAVS